MTETDALWQLIGGSSGGALVTVKRDGRPQLSIVGYFFDSSTSSALISTTDGRAKTRNLRRDPRASLYVSQPDLSGYAVGEGTVEPDDEATDRLVVHYRALRGEHPDWAEFRAAMVSERRLLVSLPLTRVYGWSAA